MGEWGYYVRYCKDGTPASLWKFEHGSSYRLENGEWEYNMHLAAKILWDFEDEELVEESVAYEYMEKDFGVPKEKIDLLKTENRRSI